MGPRAGGIRVTQGRRLRSPPFLFLSAGRTNADRAPLTLGLPSGPDSGTVLVEGSFDGAPGTFVCTPATGSTCTSSVKHGGGYLLEGGDWKFVPAEGARVPEPDGEHQYFG